MTLEEQIDALEKLRGAQDQTMRTGVIKILYGSEKIDGVTPTSRFLEDQIARLKSRQAAEAKAASLSTGVVNERFTDNPIGSIRKALSFVGARWKRARIGDGTSKDRQS